MTAQQEQPHPSIESLFAADAIQMPQEHTDDLGIELVGRVSGPSMDHFEIEVSRVSGDKAFAKRKQTQYVLVVDRATGTRSLERFKPDLYGEWEAIPDTELSPREFEKLQLGFGDQLETEGEQARKKRKEHGSASREAHPVGYHRAPRKGKHR